MEPIAEERLGVLSRRWTLHLLVMLAQEPLRFTQILRSVGGVSRRVVSERLRELVDVGLVERSVDPGPPITSTYKLSQTGERLRPTWTQLYEWSLEADQAS